MKKLLIICGYNSVYAGNFISCILKAAETLKKRYTIYLCFPEKAKTRFWVNEIDYPIYYYHNDNKFKKIKSLKSIISTNKINVIYSHFESPLLVGFISLFTTVKQIYCHIHSDFSCSKMGVKEKIRNFISFKVNIFKEKFIFVFKNKYLKSKNCYFVHNAVFKERLSRSFNDNKIAKFGNKINVLMMGWSPIVKGVDVAAKCFDKLDDKYCLYIVAGENNKNEIANLLKGLKNYYLLDPIDNIFEYIDKIDIFLSASRSEGYSYSIFESLVSHKTIVVSDIPGTNWALNYDGVFAFESENYESLLEVMNKIYNKNKDSFIFERCTLTNEYDPNIWVESINSIIK